MNVRTLPQILSLLISLTLIKLIPASAYPASSFSQVAGMPILDFNQKKIAELKDLILDLAEGRVISVVLSTADGRWHAVSPEALEFRNDQRLFLKTTAGHLPSQFNFPPDKWPDFNHAQIRSRLSVKNASDSRLNFGPLLRASELKGMRVTNFRDERLGGIKDITFNGENSRIDYLLLSTGPWAGMNHRVLSVPPALFLQHTDGKKLVINADKNRLKHAALLNHADLINTFWGASHDPGETNEAPEKKVP